MRNPFGNADRAGLGAPCAPGTTIEASEAEGWYSPVLPGAATIGEASRKLASLNVALEVTRGLAPDAYGEFLVKYYEAGIERLGEEWGYTDISTMLVAAARIAQPKSYLEIGVRRGRSMAMVVSQSPECDLVGFDMWIAGYGGNENPGEALVRDELAKLGHRGALSMVDGDSHQTVPAYFQAHPDAYFDMITVDGDHSTRGARADLECVIPRLKVGGILVFDDICHPAHRPLAQVWSETGRRHPELSTWEFTDIGFGVAVAIRTF